MEVGGGDYKIPFEYAMWREETLQLLKLRDDGRYGDGKYWVNEQWGVRSGNSKLLDDFELGRRWEEGTKTWSRLYHVEGGETRIHEDEGPWGSGDSKKKKTRAARARKTRGDRTKRSTRRWRFEHVKRVNVGN